MRFYFIHQLKNIVGTRCDECCHRWKTTHILFILHSNLWTIQYCRRNGCFLELSSRINMSTFDGFFWFSILTVLFMNYILVFIIWMKRCNNMVRIIIEHFIWVNRLSLRRRTGGFRVVISGDVVGHHVSTINGAITSTIITATITSLFLVLSQFALKKVMAIVKSCVEQTSHMVGQCIHISFNIRIFGVRCRSRSAVVRSSICRVRAVLNNYVNWSKNENKGFRTWF